MDLKKKAKEIKDKVKSEVNFRAHNVKIWWNKNKDWAVVAIPIAAGACGTGFKYFLRARNIKREEKMKYKTYWDASVGHHWELKKKPTNQQRMEIDRRWKGNGEPLSKVLYEMNLI